MKKHFLILLLFILGQVQAQTGIGTTTPDASAKLDVSSTNKGFLPPRVTLTSATDTSTIPSAAEGLLVYNKGSLGLQAGYYYWNGANWATIATGATAGNAVVATDLVKLYGEAYSAASGKIGNANGFSFTVPISGRYLFDFSCSGYASNVSRTMTFKVRQGTTDLATDSQTSYNNIAHSEYNGKVEVNLVAGTTYNVQVVYDGNRDMGDFDRVYYKMVAGNLPVNQHIADRNIQLNSNYISNDGDNEGIRIDNSGNVGIGTNAPVAKLDVNGSLGVSGTATFRSAGGDEGGEIEFGIPQTNTTLSTRVVTDVWQNRFRIFDGNTKGVYVDLSKAPTGASGEITYKASGIVNAGTFVQLDNIRATVPTSGNRSLSIATVSGSFAAYINATYTLYAGGTSGMGTTLTVTTTPVLAINWNFTAAGDTINYTIVDYTNNRAYRIMLMIGPGYNNNFIAIERLH